MKSFRTLSLILFVMSIKFCSAQNFIYKEFSIDTAHLTPFSIQPTQDGNFLVVSDQYCFVPNGTAIEGCPISDQLIKIDPELNPEIRKDIFLRRSNYNQEWTELSNGAFSVFARAPDNFNCGFTSVGLWGFDRFERYELNSELNIKEHQIYNQECEITPLSYLATKDDEQLVFARTENEYSQSSNRIIVIDSNFQIIDSLVYDSLDLSSLKVSHVKNDSLYGVFPSGIDGTLNIVAFDLKSNNHAQRTIASIGPENTYFSLDEVTKDSNGNCYAVTSVFNSTDRAYTIKLSKFTDTGELIWIQTLAEDIFGRRVRIKTVEPNRLAVLSGFENPVSNTVDSRVQVLDEEGSEILRREYEIDTTNTKPVDFEIIDNRIYIVGEANAEKNSFPSTPKKTFVLRMDNDLSSIDYVNTPSESILYPNPTNGLINIDSDCNKKLRVDIFDITGARQGSYFLKSNTINISNFEAGLYYIKLGCANTAHGIYKLVKN